MILYDKSFAHFHCLIWIYIKIFPTKCKKCPGWSCLKMSRYLRDQASIHLYSKNVLCTTPSNATTSEKHYSYQDYWDRGFYRVPKNEVGNHPSLHLNLGNNKITVLKEGMLSYISQAVAICLNYNKIKRIENKTFNCMYNLKHYQIIKSRISTTRHG